MNPLGPNNHPDPRLYEEVRVGRDQSQAILDSTREAMLLFDIQGRLLKVNRAAEEMLGQSLAPYVGQSFVRWLRATGAARLQELTGYTLLQLRMYIHGVIRYPEQTTHRQFEQVHGEETRYIDETGSPVLDQQGRTAGWLLVWRDVTEERKLDILRQELSSMIVHDLRSPLTAIISSLAMLEDLLTEEEIDVATFSEVIQIAQNSGENMLNLVQSLLDIARLEQKTLALDCESLALIDSVDYAYESVFHLALSANIILTPYVISDDLPAVWIDDEKIQRVLVNLLDNALRHTPRGGKIGVEAEMAPDETEVIVRVVDTGPGIPPEARSHIFNKFAQLDQQVLRGHKGTGLGLTFCKLAVEAHGGRIWVEDGPAGGAAFCFTLPVASARKDFLTKPYPD